jgi:hypothetical protein
MKRALSGLTGGFFIAIGVKVAIGENPGLE